MRNHVRDSSPPSDRKKIRANQPSSFNKQQEPQNGRIEEIYKKPCNTINQSSFTSLIFLANTYILVNTTKLSPLKPDHTHRPEKIDMATITMQATAAVIRPCKTRFLTGASSGKLNREVSVRASNPSSSASFSVVAKKGEWLPGLPSPAYLNGR